MSAYIDVSKGQKEWLRIESGILFVPLTKFIFFGLINMLVLFSVNRFFSVSL